VTATSCVTQAPPEPVLAIWRAWSLNPTPAQRRALARYVTLLCQANQKMNLTAYRDPDAIWLHLITDALSPIPLGLDLTGQRAVDVGSGAGIPGVPLGLWFPQATMTLMEATQKKARFLARLGTELGRPFQVLAQRAEVVGQDPEHREQYDWAFARAVAPLPTLLEYMAPLVRVGGHLLAYKGSQAEAEQQQAARAMQILGVELERITPVQGLPYPRVLVWMRKVRATPPRYPRRPGRPAKRPL